MAPCGVGAHARHGPVGTLLLLPAATASAAPPSPRAGLCRSGSGASDGDGTEPPRAPTHAAATRKNAPRGMCAGRAPLPGDQPRQQLGD